MPRSLRLALFAAALILAAAGLAAAAETLPAEIDRCPFTNRFPVEVRLDTAAELRMLADWRVDIDTVHGLTATVYVDDAQLADLRAAGFRAEPVPNAARRAWAAEPRDGREAYHTYATLTTELQQIAADHPAIVQLTSIGASVQGRELWMVKISDNVALDEPEPEFKYSAAIHGNEPVGIEMCVYLIRLLTDSYGTDPALTALVNDLEIFICPLHNPDGNANGTRYNAEGFDLNRSFPDPVDDPINDPTGRPTEVRHMMNFQAAHNVVLGSNFHTGALVVNYPWDSMDGEYTPDNAMVRDFALGYAVLNPPMYNNPEFPHGVVIGWAWYVVHGGLQDWAYYWHNEINYTIENSNTSWPASSQLAQLWVENKDAMLYLMGRARIGVEGYVTSAAGATPLKATVDVLEIGKPMWGEPTQGYYHRLLEPGTYTIRFSAFGFLPEVVSNVSVTAAAPTRLDVTLTPAASYTVSGTVTDAGSGEPLVAQIEARRHDTGELIAATTSGADGGYALPLPGWEYDLRASAPEHIDVTQTRTVAGDLTLDFALVSPLGSVLCIADGNAGTPLPAGLQALGYQVTVETPATTNSATWADYDLLVWSAGSNHAPVSVAALRTALESHVAAGGKLLIEGGEIGYDALRTPGYPSFAANVLHVSAWRTDNAGNLQRRPEQATHPLATTPNALPQTLALAYDDYGDEDAVTALADGIVVYGTTSYATDAGLLAVELAGRGAGQIVYYAFDYAALASGATAADLLENTVAYLLPTNQAVALDTRAGRLWLAPVQPSVTRGAVDLRLELPAAGIAEIALYDVSGRRVRHLMEGNLDAGAHAFAWDGRDEQGRAVAPGVYFVRASSTAGVMTRRLVMTR
jgi:hypothetical protein